MSIRHNEAEGQIRLVDGERVSDLSPYPVDMSSFLVLPCRGKRRMGEDRPADALWSPAGDHPTMVIQCALAQWNLYLTTHEEKQREAFLKQAYWLLEHEIRIGEDAEGLGGWPLSFPLPILQAEVLDNHTSGTWLSSLTQGCGISVLARAYQLTQEKVFFDIACRVVRTFERDILDGGVSTPVGVDGVFFEEVAVYPAAHRLSGFIFALFGLYDYVALTGDAQVKQLIQRSLTTLHGLLDEFDVGFWTRSDLLHRRLASPSHLALQITLLEALAKVSHCDRYSNQASHWTTYRHSLSSCLRYQLKHCCTSYGRMLWGQVQSALFSKTQPYSPTRICVSVPAFPSTGGIMTILAGVAQVTQDFWHIEYLAQHLEPGREHYIIHQFGTRRMTPWYFPFVWLYVLAGICKLLSLMHHHAGYHVILAQDGVVTGAFAALAGKLAGVRVVCIDHGDLSLLLDRNSRIYRNERIAAAAAKPWPVRLVARRLFVLYWPSRYLLARIAARFVDHYLIPGISGDGVDEMCKQLGVHPSRITRFGNMIDIDRHLIPDDLLRAEIREKYGIAVDAIVIAIVCRLAVEKGLEIALEAVSQALFALPPSLHTRIRVVIVGDGPIRKQLEEDIRTLGLNRICMLWGEAQAGEVISILGISNIFLYTSWRGAGYPLAIMEAMASGCAVIASTEPLANEYMLADGRGIVVPVGDIEQTSAAIMRLASDLELCRQMGNLARNYIALYHSPALFRRTLVRAAYWSALDDLLGATKIETLRSKSGNRL